MSMFKFVFCVILFQFINIKSQAVIYHLNDTEYQRMPPLFALDDYELCLQNTNGVYCMMELDLHGGQNAKLISVIKNYSEHTVKHYNHTYIQRGVCIQKSCQKFIKNRTLNDILILNTILEECLNNSISIEYGLEARMKELNYCDNTSDVTQKDFSDWVVAGVLAAILIMNILGSSYDFFLNKKDRSRGNQYLLSFSVLQNWQLLTSSNSSEPRLDQLKGLHAYRTIAIFLMMIAHIMWMNAMGFTANPHEFEKAYETISYQLIFNGMMIIQIFLVQSGFLLAYIALIRSEKQKISWKMWPQLIFMRWWRLTPPYAVVLAFTATWLRHLGSGPLWKLWVTNSVAADCRAYWWLHLLYIHNYVWADKFCAIHTWYLSAEMQAFTICFSLFLFTTSRGRYLVLSLLLVLGTAIPVLHVWLQDIDGIMIMEPEFYRKKVSNTFQVHILGHNYLSSYAIGMGTAVILYQIQKKGKEKTNSKTLQILSMCFFPAMICLFLTGQVFYADVPRAHLAVRMVCAAGHRLVMGGIVAFAIFSLVMRFNESICALFEYSAWVVAGRLSYCVYLVHLNFIHILLGNRTYLMQVSFYNMIIIHLGVALMSFMTALPLHLLVEAPTAALMKLFTRR